MLRLIIDTSSIKIIDKKETSVHVLAWTTKKTNNVEGLSCLLLPNNNNNSHEMDLYVDVITGGVFNENNKPRSYRRNTHNIPSPSTINNDLLWFAVYVRTKTNGLGDDNVLFDRTKQSNIRYVTSATGNPLHDEYTYQVHLSDVYVDFKTLVNATDNHTYFIPVRDKRLKYELGDTITEESYSRGKLVVHVSQSTTTSQREAASSSNSNPHTTILTNKQYGDDDLEQHTATLDQTSRNSTTFKHVGTDGFNVDVFEVDNLKRYNTLMNRFLASYKSNFDRSSSFEYKENHLFHDSIEKDGLVGLFNGKRIKPSSSELCNIHMPYFETDIGKMPLLYYYLHRTDPDHIGTRHATYLSKFASYIIHQTGITPNVFTKCINTYFDNLENNGNINQHHTRSSDPNDVPFDFMMCMDIFCEFITSFANSSKYRSDYRFSLPRGKLVPVESVDFDLKSTGSSCDDCEGLDCLTQEIFYIIQTGPIDGTYLLDDDNEHVTRKTKDLARGLNVNPRRWKYDVLNTMQRITLYYLNISSLLSVLGAFHGDTIQKHTLNQMISNFTIGSRGDTTATVSAHMNAFLIPTHVYIGYMTRVIDDVISSTSSSSKILGTTRHDLENCMNDLRRISQLYEHIDRYNIRLPILAIESTGRMNAILSSGTNEQSIRMIKQRMALEKEICDRIDGENLDTILTPRCLSTLTWTPDVGNGRRVSPFYRMITFVISPQLHAINPLLSWGMFVDTTSERWGVQLNDMIIGTNDNRIGVVPIFPLIEKNIVNNVDETAIELAKTFPPVLYGMFKEKTDYYMQTSIDLVTWLKQFVVKENDSMGVNQSLYDYYSKHDTKRYESIRTIIHTTRSSSDNNIKHARDTTIISRYNNTIRYYTYTQALNISIVGKIIDHIAALVRIKKILSVNIHEHVVYQKENGAHETVFILECTPS